MLILSFLRELSMDNINILFGKLGINLLASGLF
jgi:hypothetical protein